MKTTFSREQRRGKRLWAAAVALGLGLAGASAQLAITEVMSHPAIFHHGVLVPRESDWWELTNFGTNQIDLTGYYFRDRLGAKYETNCFSNLLIGHDESIIFFRSNNTTTVELFKQWWGPCLKPDVQFGLHNIGLNPVEDGVRLYDTNGTLVDSVDFGAARQGVTFVCDTESGDFGVFSRLDMCGSCQAETTDDIGSPGTTCGPVLLRILEQPASLVVCKGSDRIICVRACGLPRPKYEWQVSRNGSSWEPIAGANSSCLTILDAQSSHEGEYRVVVTNGLESLVSASAWVTVDTNLSLPILLTNLSNVGKFCELERFVDENARFTNVVCAFPRAHFQWYSNGVPILGAEDRVLVVSNVTLAMSGTIYSVTSSNQLGSTNASARLWVYPRPKLEFTEVMPAPSIINGPWAGHANWFELTNRGTNTVKLRGFRHSDALDLFGAKVITNNVELLPGESVVFVEAITRDAFACWWGVTNLPPAFKLITYHGFGLSRWGETIRLWSPGAESVEDYLVYMDWASPTPFPMPATVHCECDPELCDHPIDGHSLFFDENDDCAWRGRVCKEGENGAFRAAESDDVGSPGFARNPLMLSFRRVGATWTLQCRIIQGRQYRLEATDGFAQNLAATVWIDLGTHTAQGSTLSITDTPGPGVRHRFYRLRELP